MSSAPSQSSSSSQLLDRWGAKTTKRILTIHSPLSRLPLTFAWLEAIERWVRPRAGEDGGGQLADYFDLIAGSGGGAVVAAMLAQGMSCGGIERQLGTLVAAALTKNSPLAQLTSNLLGDRWLREPLGALFGTGGSLKDQPWRTGVCLHAFRLERQAPHAFHNHPDGGFTGFLAAALEACLAYPPHPLPVLAGVMTPTDPVDPTELASGTPEELLHQSVPATPADGVFADARLALAGGAAWSTMVVATSPAHPFRWPMGADQLLMVSVGGGFWTARETVAEASQRNVLQQAARLPEMLLRDAAREECWLMEGLARTTAPRLVEPGEESDGEDPWFSEPALTWLRCDLELDAGPLSALGLTPDETLLRRLREPGNSGDLSQLKAAGNRAAAAQMRDDHFPRNFDPDPDRIGPRGNETRPQMAKK